MEMIHKNILVDMHYKPIRLRNRRIEKATKDATASEKNTVNKNPNNSDPI